MKPLIALVLIAVSASSGIGAELPREWTSVDGRTLKAALHRATATGVTLTPSRGQTVDLPLTKLSQADQDYVKQWLLDEPKRASHFTIELIGAKSGATQAFLKANDSSRRSSGGGARFVGGGAPLSISNMAAGYTVSTAAGDVVYEVRARLVPGKTATAAQTLSFDKLRLRYFSAEEKNEETDGVGARWIPADKSKIGDHKTLVVETGKPIEFGVAFVLSSKDQPLALEYKGDVEFQIPLR